MKVHICSICGNSERNSIYIVKEMMLGFHDEFEYFQCSMCGCLQISKVPKNLSKYYPNNYYSFSNNFKNNIIEKLKVSIKRQFISFKLGRKNIIGYILSHFYNEYSWIFKDLCNYNSKILDIGSGNGKLLLDLKRLGFMKLKGLDPYILHDIYYPNGVTIFKKDILEITETFDLIMLHHSFEHMENPKEVLQKIYNILNPRSYVIIRIPVVSSYAFRKYGINWVQLDAPRHFYLHTPTSINILAKETKFKIFKTIYDSTSLQFSGSENYENNYLIDQVARFSKKQINLFKNEARRLNSINDGDSACFFLLKE